MNSNLCFSLDFKISSNIIWSLISFFLCSLSITFWFRCISSKSSYLLLHSFSLYFCPPFRVRLCVRACLSMCVPVCVCVSVCLTQARGDKFKFDPLLATELREAAITLGVTGLIDLCDKGEWGTQRSPMLFDSTVSQSCRDWWWSSILIFCSAAFAFIFMQYTYQFSLMLLIYIIIVTLLLPLLRLLHRLLLYLHHESVLGSFQERVRRSPIRLSEVIERNRAGTECSRVAGAIYCLQWFLCSSCNDYCITLLDPFSSFQKHR